MLTSIVSVVTMGGSQVLEVPLPFALRILSHFAGCQCNDHAVSCTYDADVGHGVCDDCQHNTRGFFCEQCVDGLYRNDSLPLSSPDVCAGGQRSDVM